MLNLVPLLIPIGITAALIWRVVWELRAGKLISWMAFFPADRVNKPRLYWAHVGVAAIGAAFALAFTVLIVSGVILAKSSNS